MCVYPISKMLYRLGYGVIIDGTECKIKYRAVLVYGYMALSGESETEYGAVFGDCPFPRGS